MGKSYTVGITVPFLITYLPNYIKDLKIDRFYTIIGNQNYDMVEESFSKFMPYIDKCVEFFNKNFPNSPILLKSKNVKALNEDWYNNDLAYNNRKIELARVLNNKVIPYSCIFALSAGERVDVSGQSAHLIN